MYILQERYKQETSPALRRFKINSRLHASNSRSSIIGSLNTRGGLKVVEALCRMLPEADIFTLFYDPSRVSPTIRSHRVHSSFLQPLRKHYRSLLPLMPMALESLDLRGYDLVLSSESGLTKSVICAVRRAARIYCHTPMRYLWDLYPAYRNEWTTSRWKRAAMTPLSLPETVGLRVGRARRRFRGEQP